MNRFIAITAALAVASLNVGMAVGPAHAKMSAEEQCEVMPANIRAAVQGAEASKARRALSKASIGAALCEAGNEREARKKFAQALKALGMTETELAQR
ncbi:hypothetical protein KCG44_07175 [Pacificimonas sp. WHA3]|uniref:Uncharacterized protein n=1 Tax=Pacificimonas pallii TaxID=2827236 RepID=A0ABS6SDS5_9SPHN|nr:hypothetical protein [Pacificimonas pallii]MBV7256565.1 hypothetical protein [Pacificimonas pallii]